MKRSFTIMVTGLMVVLLMALFSAAASGAGNVSVAVVNIDKVINESLAGQGANRVLLQLIKEKQDELNKVADNINTLQKRLKPRILPKSNNS